MINSVSIDTAPPWNIIFSFDDNSIETYKSNPGIIYKYKFLATKGFYGKFYENIKKHSKLIEVTGRNMVTQKDIEKDTQKLIDEELERGVYPENLEDIGFKLTEKESNFLQKTFERSKP